MASLLSLSLSLYAGTAGSFFAISGAITTSLLVLIFLCGEVFSEIISQPNTLLYLIFYALTLLFNISLLIRGLFSLGSQQTSLLFGFLLKFEISQTKAKTLSTLFVLSLSLFAGLPPFITFYVKLFILSSLICTFSGAWFLLFFLLLFFTLLYFYFKNDSFVLIQPSFLNQARVKSIINTSSGPTNFVEFNKLTWLLDPFIIFLSLLGFFFLSEFATLFL